MRRSALVLIPVLACGCSEKTISSSVGQTPFVEQTSVQTTTNEESVSRAVAPLFFEDFNSYPNDTALWTRGGPYLNQWRRTVPPGGAVQLIRNKHRKSGRAAVELRQAGTSDSPYSNAILYYRMPIARVAPRARVGVSGWVSFENVRDARLFFLNELWTGRIEPVKDHYGHREALLAGGVQYNSRTRTWQWEHGGGNYPYTDFSEPVDYEEGLDRFHYFKLVVDFRTDHYVSFQFDDQTWDLSDHKLMVFEPDTGHEPTPAMFELNVRLITYDEYEGPYQCRAVVDDVAVTGETKLGGDQ
jgi:hypothetical protein